MTRRWAAGRGAGAGGRSGAPSTDQRIAGGGDARPDAVRKPVAILVERMKTVRADHKNDIGPKRTSAPIPPWDLLWRQANVVEALREVGKLSTGESAADSMCLQTCRRASRPSGGATSSARDECSMSGAATCRARHQSRSTRNSANSCCVDVTSAFLQTAIVGKVALRFLIGRRTRPFRRMFSAHVV